MSKRRRDARRALRRKAQGGDPQGMPGMGNMSSKQMQKAIANMDTEEINDVIEVIVRTKDEDIILQSPEVSIMNMGQEVWSVVPKGVERRPAGEVKIVETEKEEDMTLEIKPEDVKLIMSSANVSEEVATSALRKNNGDLAAAIMHLT